MTAEPVEAAVPPPSRSPVLFILRTWLASPALRVPLGVFCLTRILFLILTYAGVILFQSPAPHPDLQAPQPSFLHQLLPSWRQWDAVWYINIAQKGYTWKTSAGTSPTAFFPLYPLLIHVGVWLTHLSATTVGLVVSNLCFLAALVYLFRLTSWETDRGTAGRTVLYVAAFPTALFFFAGYTESLFLLLTVAAFYYLRRGDWMVAGLCGGLASSTRVTGVLLMLPFLYEYARDANFSPRAMLRPGLVGLFLIPCGLIAYMAFLGQVVGDPWAFTHDQVAWQKIFTPRLWSGITNSIRNIVQEPAASFDQVHNLINLSAALLFLAGTVVVARRLPAAYTIYLVAFWVVTLASPALAGGYPIPLVSMARYVLSLFPVFMVFGLLGRHSRFHDTYLVLGAGLLAMLTLIFVNGRWIV